MVGGAARAAEAIGAAARCRSDAAELVDLRRSVGVAQAGRPAVSRAICGRGGSAARSDRDCRQRNLRPGVQPEPVRAHSLNQVGNWHVTSERPREGLHLHREALAIFEARNDQAGLAATLDLLGMAYSQAGGARRIRTSRPSRCYEPWTSATAWPRPSRLLPCSAASTSTTRWSLPRRTRGPLCYVCRERGSADCPCHRVACRPGICATDLSWPSLSLCRSCAPWLSTPRAAARPAEARHLPARRAVCRTPWERAPLSLAAPSLTALVALEQAMPSELRVR